MRHAALCYTAWLSLCLGIRAPAALLWQNPVLVASVKADATPLSFAFRFENTGTFPVTITGVKTSCDCTTVDFQRFTCAPGTTGELRVTYDAHGQTGTKVREVYVNCSDKKEPVILSLRVTTYEYYALSRSSVRWPLHGRGESQTVDVVIDPSLSGKVAVSAFPHSNFTVELFPAPTLPGYTLRLTPRSTSFEVGERLKLQIMLEGHPPVPATINLQIQ